VNTLRLALRLLRRDWRAGELRVLVAALILAVGSVGTVGFFADRVKGALTTQANLLLGADIMVSGDRPLPLQLTETATQRGLATTPVIRFNSMVPPSARRAVGSIGGAVDVKAVGEGYPLRGSIVLVDPGRSEGKGHEGHSQARRGLARPSPGRSPRCCDRRPGSRSARRR
jgi:putative ABC transport system permease protein